MDNAEMMARHTAVMEQIGAANGEKPKAAPAPIDKPAEPADNVEVTQADPADAARTDIPDGEEEHDEDSADSDGDDPTTPPRKPRASRKIGKLTKEKYEALRRADAAELRLQMMEQYLQSQQAPQQQPTQTLQTQTGAPTKEQFGYDEDAYQAARDQWVVQQAEARFEQKFQQREAQRQTEAQGSEFQAGIAALEQENPGAWTKAVSAQIVTTPAMDQAIFRCGKLGAKVGFYLATHPDEANAIARQHPIDQVAAIGEIRAAVKAAPAISPRPPKAVPAVSAPSAPLPSGSSTLKKSLENETIEEAAARIREWNRNH
jgi:hypothetical protein